MVKGRFDDSDSFLEVFKPGDCVFVGVSVGNHDGSDDALVLIIGVGWDEPAVVSTEETGFWDSTSPILATDQPWYL